MAQSRFQSLDWYDTPLYYDIVFEEDTEKEVDFLEAMAELYGRRPTQRVLEPACGSGRVLAAMARRGYQMTGFDANPHMLSFAENRMAKLKLPAELLAGRLEKFQLEGSFDLAFCLVSTFKYLLTEKEARSHLQCVAKHLAPGALYVLGFHLSEYGIIRSSRERWVGERNGVHVVSNLQIWPARRKERLEKVRSRLRIEEKGEVRQQEHYWEFRTYNAAQVRRLLRTVPALEHVATYDFTYELESERALDDQQLDVVLILRKRS
ncbi:MAG: class I SAM-dependent methyltransferase [Planctomycetota bacterium]|nr:MAG: class I SAM-dependent methyltransferase [Planctomycetota bacterium]